MQIIYYDNFIKNGITLLHRAKITSNEWKISLVAYACQLRNGSKAFSHFFNTFLTVFPLILQKPEF